MGNILWTIAIILLIAWLIGYLGFSEAVGAYIHILLALAIIVILIRLLTGKNPV